MNEPALSDVQDHLL